MKTKQLTLDAMLAAMCAVLGYVALDMGSIKITFESLPILLGAMLFGPVDGMLIGGIGTLIYQLLRYGVAMLTPLWILPYVLCGLIVGYWAKKRDFNLAGGERISAVVLAELVVTVLNTGVLYLDSKLMGYWFLGFILVAYMGLGTVGVAAFGAVIVTLVVMNDLDAMKKEKASIAAGTVAADEEEDFFA